MLLRRCYPSPHNAIPRFREHTRAALHALAAMRSECMRGYTVRRFFFLFFLSMFLSFSCCPPSRSFFRFLLFLSVCRSFFNYFILSFSLFLSFMTCLFLR